MLPGGVIVLNRRPRNLLLAAVLLARYRSASISSEIGRCLTVVPSTEASAGLLAAVWMLLDRSDMDCLAAAE